MGLKPECEAFYTERDRRTISYGAAEHVLDIPVAIGIDTAASSTRAGQIALWQLASTAVCGWSFHWLSS